MSKLKVAAKNAIPQPLLNKLLLRFPALYHTPLVNYETNLEQDPGVRELLSQLAMALELPGNVIECGSSRCGASIIMANYLLERRVEKLVYACDSYSGFDRSELRRERKLGLTNASDKAFTSTSYSYVKAKLRKLGLEQVVVPVKGYFQQTLPHIDSEFCFAFIDCDLKESLRYCAETLWPRMAGGGRILFDDYTHPDFKGARLGVDQFVKEHSAEIDEHGLLQRLYYVRKRAGSGERPSSP